MMHRGLWNMDHASFFSEATLIEIGLHVYTGIRLLTWEVQHLKKIFMLKLCDVISDLLSFNI